MRLPALIALSALLLVATATRSGSAAEGYESPPAVRASQLLEPQLLRSAAHTVQERVTTNGFFHEFDIQTPYGLWKAPSRTLLKLRVQEAQGLQRAGSVNVAGEVFKAAEGKLKQLPTSTVKVLSNPFAAVKSTGGGLFRTFGNLTHAFDKRTSAQGEQSGVESALYGRELREAAVKLGLDPYSSNPKVRAFLNDLARARALGNFAAGQLTGQIPGGGSLAASAIDFYGDVASDVVDKSPSELDRQHQAELSSMGIHRYVIQRFLGNAHLSPTHRVTLVKAVQRLQGVEDRGALLEAAAEAGDEVHALMNATRALMVVEYHEKTERFTSLHAAGAIVVGRTAGGTLVVPAPLDILYWNREAAAGAQALAGLRDKLGATSLYLRLTGRMTKRAIEEFRRRGFRVAWGVPTPHESARAGK